MKFADKLFFATIALLTLIFTAFGIWMLSSNFSQMLNREIDRANSQSRMFHYLFEMGCRSMEEFGDDYAVPRTIDSIVDNVERDGAHCFIGKMDGTYYYGGEYLEAVGFQEVTEALTGALGEETYGYCIRDIGGSYYMFTAAISDVTKEPVILGMCMDLTPVYRDRQGLMNQYRLALVILLLVGSVCVYALSRYITRPISRLNKLAGRIAEGSYELRSHNKSRDEIGTLARNFNRMADRLVEQMEEKVKEARQKEDFTAAFAHELKTPLTSIIGYADMLNSMKISEEERAEATFYIYSQGKRLESLSHKLLDLVGMDKNPLALRPIQTRQLEENIRTTMRPIFRQRGIKGKISMDKGTLHGDMELLLSLFYNLLDNAVKAMDKGEDGFILLKGTVREGGYEVKVVDNGRGIPKEEISRVTEAFYMVDKSRSRKEGGAGIGMALCQKIILLHGATLKIDSRLGEGTVMKVIFPMQAGNRPPGAVSGTGVQGRENRPPVLGKRAKAGTQAGKEAGKG